MSSSNIDDLIKISLIGSPAVGKTTILKLLTKSTIDKIYQPTQGFDLKTAQFKKFKLRIWDFGGQKAFRNYLKDYLLGSDLVFIVTDSSPRNVLNSRELIDIASFIVERDCPIIGIANKQDLCKNEGRLESKRVEDILQCKTFGLTAINPAERQKLVNIIEKELNHVLIRRRLKEIEF
jgi:ADP-ribosylation factor-like protein 2